MGIGGGARLGFQGLMGQMSSILCLNPRITRAQIQITAI